MMDSEIGIFDLHAEALLHMCEVLLKVSHHAHNMLHMSRVRGSNMSRTQTRLSPWYRAPLGKPASTMASGPGKTQWEWEGVISLITVSDTSSHCSSVSYYTFWIWGSDELRDIGQSFATSPQGIYMHLQCLT